MGEGYLGQRVYQGKIRGDAYSTRGLSWMGLCEHRQKELAEVQR